MGEHTAEDRGVESSILSRPIMGKYSGHIKYNNLVRDRIPEIIERSGAKYKIHVADDDEYWDKLKKKIGEEINEFLKDPCIEELADILEVLYAIADFKFEGKKELERIRAKKFEERGGFKKKLILEETDDR